MTDPDDVRLAARMGPKQFRKTYDGLTTREKLAAARSERAQRAQQATEWREARRREVVDSGYIADEAIRETSTELDRDVEDFDSAIAELERRVAEEDATAKLKAEEAAAAAEAERQAERKQTRAQAATKLDEALAAAEAAYRAWVAEQRDLPVQLQNRRPLYLRSALHKLAPELARVLDVQRVPHNHQRPLAEVSL